MLAGAGRGYGAVDIVHHALGDQILQIVLLAAVFIRAGVAGGRQSSGMVATGRDLYDVLELIFIFVQNDLSREHVGGAGHVAAHLALVVGTPGKHMTFTGQSYAVAGAQGQGGDVGQIAAAEGTGILRGALDLGGHVPVGRAAVTQLAVAVEAPGKHGAVGTDGHGVRAAGGDAGDTGHIAAAVIAQQPGGAGTGLVRVDTQLAVGIVAPGVDTAVRSQRHGELIASRHPDHILQGTALAAHIGDQLRLGIGCGGVGQTQLAAGVQTPGVNGAFLSDGKHVVTAGGDGKDLDLTAIRLCREHDLNRRILCVFMGAVGTIGIKGKAGAQLTIVIDAPGPDGTVAPQSHGKVAAGAHHGHGDCAVIHHGEQHGSGVDGRAVGRHSDIEADGSSTEALTVGRFNGPHTVLGLPDLHHIGVGAGHDHMVAPGVLFLGVAVKVKALIVDLMHLTIGPGHRVALSVVERQRHGRLVACVLPIVHLLTALGSQGGILDLQAVVGIGTHMDGEGPGRSHEVAHLSLATGAPSSCKALMVHNKRVVITGGQPLGVGQIGGTDLHLVTLVVCGLDHIAGSILNGVEVLAILDKLRGSVIALDVGRSHGLVVVSGNTQLALLVGAPGVHVAVLGGQQRVGSARRDVGHTDHATLDCFTLQGVHQELFGGGQRTLLGQSRHIQIHGLVDAFDLIVISASLGHQSGQQVGLIALAAGIGGVAAQLAVAVFAPTVDRSAGSRDGPFHQFVLIILTPQGHHVRVTQAELSDLIQHHAGVGQIVIQVVIILVNITIRSSLCRVAGGFHQHRVGKLLVPGGVVTQLAVGVVAPGPDGAVTSQNGTGAPDSADAGGVHGDSVVEPGTLAHAAALTDILRHQGTADAVHDVTGLAVGGIAPSQHGAVLQQSQGVIIACGNIHHAGKVVVLIGPALIGLGVLMAFAVVVHGVPVGADAGQDPDGIGGGVAAGPGAGGGAVAQLAAAVIAPGVHVPLRGEGQHMTARRLILRLVIVHRQGDNGAVGSGAAPGALGGDVAQHADAVDANDLSRRLNDGGSGIDRIFLLYLLGRLQDLSIGEDPRRGQSGHLLGLGIDSFDAAAHLIIGGSDLGPIPEREVSDGDIHICVIVYSGQVLGADKCIPTDSLIALGNGEGGQLALVEAVDVDARLYRGAQLARATGGVYIHCDHGNRRKGGQGVVGRIAEDDRIIAPVQHGGQDHIGGLHSGIGETDDHSQALILPVAVTCDDCITDGGIESHIGQVGIPEGLGIAKILIRILHIAQGIVELFALTNGQIGIALQIIDGILKVGGRIHQIIHAAQGLDSGIVAVSAACAAHRKDQPLKAVAGLYLGIRQRIGLREGIHGIHNSRIHIVLDVVPQATQDQVQLLKALLEGLQIHLVAGHLLHQIISLVVGILFI